METETSPKAEVRETALCLPQFIFVVDDSDLENGNHSGRSKDNQTRDKASNAQSPPWDWPRNVVDNVGGALGEAATNITKGLRGEGVDATPVSRSQAVPLDFPPGHPQNRVLYVRHPVELHSYLPAAYFHRRVFEHKFFEAVRLLMMLGAKEMEVRHISGWGKEFSLGLDLPFGLKVEAKGDADTKTRLLFTGCLEGAQDPEVPQDLHWFHSEPGWRAIADGRTRCGLRQFSMIVSCDDDFGVSASLKDAAGKVNLRLGGEFHGHQSTTWRIDATF